MCVWRGSALLVAAAAVKAATLLLLTSMVQVLADCGFTCDCREKIQTEFDIVFSDEEARCTALSASGRA